MLLPEKGVVRRASRVTAGCDKEKRRKRGLGYNRRLPRRATISITLFIRLFPRLALSLSRRSFLSFLRPLALARYARTAKPPRANNNIKQESYNSSCSNIKITNL